MAVSSYVAMKPMSYDNDCYDKIAHGCNNGKNVMGVINCFLKI